MTHSKRIKRIRAALINKYGKRNYRITSSEDVHVYSIMPNSNTLGWWLMGDLWHAEDWLGIDRGQCFT